MSTIIQDLRFGLRMLAKNPGFTAVAILSLALGIGGNATVFSWMQAVLLHPLSGVKDSSRLFAVETVMPDGTYHTSSYPDYKDYRDRNHVFSGLIGCELVAVDMKLGNEDHPQRNWGLLVTENYFDVLGVHAARGAVFHANEARGEDSDPYIVISDALWRGRFGGDPNVVGKTVQLNQHPFTVIGVVPKGFMGTIVGIAASYWVPMMMQPQVLPGESLTYRAPTFIHMLGMLKPGVSVGQARAEMNTLAGRLERQYPTTNRNIGVYVCPLWGAHYGLQAFLLPVLMFLMGVAVLVLLIACANVANLLLSRATVREKEIAIRSAVGASRARLVRQMLAESLLMALLGGAGGIFLAMQASGFLMFSLPPAHLPIGLSLGVNERVLGFVLILSIFTTFLFGLAPALQTSLPRVNECLKEGGRTSSTGASKHRLRNLLIITETAMALVLLVGAGLLARSLRSSEEASPGFNVDHVLLTAMDLRGIGYSDDQSAAFYGRLLDRIKTLSGVKAASLERWVPLWFTGRGYTRPTIEGYTPKPNEDIDIDYNVVGPGYFSTMQIPVISGREFNDRDRPGAPLVCLINQTMARRFWPGENPIGHRLNSWDQWWTIAGVVKDVKYHSMNEKRESFLYFPFLQDTGTDANILVRTAGDPDALLAAVQGQAHALDPQATILESANLRNLFNVSLFTYRTAATLAAVLGLLGLLLASSGIYGVMSYSVSQRTHEMGIRMALGAQRADVMRLVVGQGLRLVITGVGIGIIGAIGLTRLMSSLLYGVKPTDPATFVAVSLILMAAALLASYIPARRATKVDPMVALRNE